MNPAFQLRDAVHQSMEDNATRLLKALILAGLFGIGLLLASEIGGGRRR